MVNHPPGRSKSMEEPDTAGEHALVRNWRQRNRYFVAQTLLAERRPTGVEPGLSQTDQDRKVRDWVITIALGLMMLAGSTWFAGLW